MRIVISSNYAAKKGLLVDARILTKLLEGMGHEVLAWQFDDNAAGDRWGKENWGDKIDLLIFLEVVNPCFFRWARRSLFVPNQEWFKDESRYLLPRIDAVLCKTLDAVRLFTPLTKQVYYTGFTSEDHYDAAIPKQRAFFHNPGQSTAKNTMAVLAAWGMFQLPQPLTILGGGVWPVVRGVRYIKFADKAAQIRLQNEHQFHICASAAEGWSHYLHEALLTKAVVITTNAAPMNEFKGCPEILMIRPRMTGRQGLATTNIIDPMGVRTAVERCWSWTETDLREVGEKARETELEGNTLFGGRFCRLIEYIQNLGHRDKIEIGCLE